MTGLLAQSQGLSFLVGSDTETPLLPPSSTSRFSPSMQAYIAALNLTDGGMNANVTTALPTHRAAGVVKDQGFSKSTRLFIPPDRPPPQSGNGLIKVARFLGLRRKNSDRRTGGGFGESQQILGAEGQLGQHGGTVDVSCWHFF